MLDVVISATLVATGSTEALRMSWNKTKKMSTVKPFVKRGHTSTSRKKIIRRKNVPSSLCERVIRSKEMPKFDESGGRSVPCWYSYPKKINSDIVGKSVDYPHNLIHLRVRSCTTGIVTVTSDAWKYVPKTHKTKLNPALIENLIDKQSVPNARTFFPKKLKSVGAGTDMRRLHL